MAVMLDTSVSLASDQTFSCIYSQTHRTGVCYIKVALTVPFAGKGTHAWFPAVPRDGKAAGTCIAEVVIHVNSRDWHARILRTLCKTSGLCYIDTRSIHAYHDHSFE